jgi:hypothetical protein
MLVYVVAGAEDCSINLLLASESGASSLRSMVLANIVHRVLVASMMVLDLVESRRDGMEQSSNLLAAYSVSKVCTGTYALIMARMKVPQGKLQL